jgi:hypothetical protein
MKLVLSTAQLIFLLTGLGFQVAAFNNTTQQAPHLPSTNPRHWKPHWMTREWYSGRGYSYMWISTIGFAVAAVCGIVEWLL